MHSLHIANFIQAVVCGHFEISSKNLQNRILTAVALRYHMNIALDNYESNTMFMSVTILRENQTFPEG